MELKVEIGFDELLHAVQQLPESQRAILKKELDKDGAVSTLSTKKKTVDDELTDFQKMLLNGPVMSDEHYKAFKETRKQFKKWSKV